jgi:hypothetical protein
MNFRPDFLGVGAAKAATTTLRDILSQHPKIYLPDSKEMHFFDMDENYGRGKDWYQSTAFPGIRDEKICGEFSPSYMYFDHVPGRILESYGRDVKFIFIFRQPVDRAFSHYQMHQLRGAEELDFLQAIEAEPGRLQTGNQNDQRRYSYIDRGYYAKQLRNFLQCFSMEQMHFLLFGEFIQAQDEAIGRILNFLDVDVIPLRTTLQSNPANRPKSRVVANILFKRARWKNLVKPIVPEKMRRKGKQKLKRLIQGAVASKKLDAEIRGDLFSKFYVDEVDDLADLTGLNLDVWRK